MSAEEMWVQRTGPSTVVVRRGLRIVLSLIDDGEVERIGHELIAVATAKPSDVEAMCDHYSPESQGCPAGCFDPKPTASEADHG